MDICMNGGCYLGKESSAAGVTELHESVVVRDIMRRTTGDLCKGEDVI